jgi:ABC-type sugar transport system substrate-binding protein
MPCAYAPGAAPRRRRLLRLGAAFCITAGVAATSTGCARQESGRRALSIAVIPKGTSHEFWKSIHAGAVKASRELSSAAQIFPRWNPLTSWMRQVEDFQRAA